jgi:hypothetical protein
MLDSALGERLGRFFDAFTAWKADAVRITARRRAIRARPVAKLLPTSAECAGLLRNGDQRIIRSLPGDRNHQWVIAGGYVWDYEIRLV